MKKLKLVDGAKDWKKWISARFHGLNVAFILTWNLLPEKFQDAYPPEWVMGTSIVLIACGFAGSLVKQELPSDK
jgi:hypothetical protein